MEKKMSNVTKIILVLVIIIIGVAIALTIKYIIDNANDERLRQEQSNDNTVEEGENNDITEDEVKKDVEDKIYGLTSYTETYNENPIEIKEMKQDENNYIQIDGLKNKTIQANINKKLQNIAFGFEQGKADIPDVTANFANILSVQFINLHTNDNGYGIKTANIDLTTGEEIPIDKVFVSSAPFNSYLKEALCKNLAWHELYEDYEGVEKYDAMQHMDNIDFSKYEDKVLKFVKKYEEKKEDIEYLILPRGIVIYGLMDDETEDVYIEFFDRLEEVAIYKRYLTKESIFEKSNSERKNIIVLTKNSLIDGRGGNLNYGKIENNIFVEEVFMVWDDIDVLKAKSYLTKIYKTREQEIRKEVSSEQGLIYQSIYEVQKAIDKDYILVWEQTSKAICTKQYFQEDAFKDYVKMHNVQSVELLLHTFDEQKDEFKNFDITGETKYYYFSLDGEFLGNTEEEADEKSIVS